MQSIRCAHIREADLLSLTVSAHFYTKTSRYNTLGFTLTRDYATEIEFNGIFSRLIFGRTLFTVTHRNGAVLS